MDKLECPFLQERVKRKLIMLVEDDEMLATMLYHVLKQETPYHVCLTTNGLVAWKFLQHVKPHLLLLDHRLPHVDGLQLYERIRGSQHLHDIPVLLLSAVLPVQKVEQRGLAYLEKPFELDELLHTIHTLIG